MADFTPTATAVKPLGTARPGIGGGAFDAGAAIRKNTSGRWVKAQADSAINAGEDGDVAVAVSTCEADGGSFLYQNIPGELVQMSGMTPGRTYSVSAATAGVYAPESDIDTANGYNTVMFIALSATVAQLVLKATGVTL